MREKEQIISAIAGLGESFKDASFWEKDVQRAFQKNQWFIPENSYFALQAWRLQLERSNIENFASQYTTAPLAKRIGVVMAGNIPLVGLHDLICVLLSGHIAVVKLSKDDEVLMRSIIDLLQADSSFVSGRIEVVDKLGQVDAVIATGSNNTARYFEYYFQSIPRLIRKNRTSVAVITAEDDEEILYDLGEDIFRYFGLGCRNVGKIYVPKGFDITKLLDQLMKKNAVADHNKYFNNYAYHRAMYLLNQTEHLDTGFLLVKEDESMHSQLGCLFYEYYDDVETLKNTFNTHSEVIQCVVTSNSNFENRILPGTSQMPMLSEFADDIDTMNFLISV